MIHGDAGNDTIVSGLGNDEIFGDAGANTLAYASVQQQGIDIVDRGTDGVTAVLPNTGQTANGGKTGGPEKDIIHSDIGTLVGGNGNDVLVGNNLANTIVGVAPAGTAGVKPGPAGNDVLAGARRRRSPLRRRGERLDGRRVGKRRAPRRRRQRSADRRCRRRQLQRRRGQRHQPRPRRHSRRRSSAAPGPTASPAIRPTPRPRATARRSAAVTAGPSARSAVSRG